MPRLSRAAYRLISAAVLIALAVYAALSVEGWTEAFGAVFLGVALWQLASWWWFDPRY